MQKKLDTLSENSVGKEYHIVTRKDYTSVL